MMQKNRSAGGVIHFKTFAIIMFVGIFFMSGISTALHLVSANPLRLTLISGVVVSAIMALLIHRASFRDYR